MSPFHHLPTTSAAVNYLMSHPYYSFNHHATEGANGNIMSERGSADGNGSVGGSGSVDGSVGGVVSAFGSVGGGGSVAGRGNNDIKDPQSNASEKFNPFLTPGNENSAKRNGSAETVR